MFALPIPYAVLMSPLPGVYPGDGGLEIETWCERYIESGQAWREFEQRCAENLRCLQMWVDTNGQYDPSEA